MKITNNAQIAILMATYNGEKYLKEQIESIISQTFQGWTLYIQDDGSTDRTVEITKSYESDKIKLVDVGLTRQGVCMNFMSLLNMVESDYYMFCDQDDVWLPQKVEKSYKKMKEEESKSSSDIPILVYTDKSRTDANLNITLKSEFNRKGYSERKLSAILNERQSLNLLRLITHIAGCEMLFNNAAKRVSIPYNNSRYHDSVVAMAVAKNNGIIGAVREPLMLYRIHGTNTCGVHETSMFEKMKTLRTWIKGQIRMFFLWKIYGGGNLFKFLYYRYRLFVTRL